jgi:hypothetical protein
VDVAFLVRVWQSGDITEELTGTRLFAVRFVSMGDNAGHPLCFALCCIIAGTSMRKRIVYPIAAIFFRLATAVLECANVMSTLDQTRPCTYTGTHYGSARILASTHDSITKIDILVSR